MPDTGQITGVRQLAFDQHSFRPVFALGCRESRLPQPGKP